MPGKPSRNDRGDPLMKSALRFISDNPPGMTTDWFVDHFPETARVTTKEAQDVLEKLKREGLIELEGREGGIQTIRNFQRDYGDTQSTTRVDHEIERLRLELAEQRHRSSNLEERALSATTVAAKTDDKISKIQTDIDARLDEIRKMIMENASSFARHDAALGDITKRLDNAEGLSRSTVNKEDFQREVDRFANSLKEASKQVADLQADHDRMKTDYMPKSFWYTVVYPIVTATAPALVVGLIFYLLIVVAKV